MAPCKASDLSLDIPATPGIPIPGFGGIPISGPQIDLPSFDLPTDLIEDIVGWVQQIFAVFPSSTYRPNIDNGMHDILAPIANVLSQIAPFLSLYSFFTPALKLFTCIIEILCAIPNPIAIILKLKKLFTECLPPFIAMFPFLALIAMIIAFLLLLYHLIVYIIETILAIIDELIKNIMLFADVESLQDASATLAIAQKIASILCFIDSLMAIFVAVAAIMAIIQTLMQLAGGEICSDDDSEGCCSDDLCPPFIKNAGDGIVVQQGKLQYYHKIKTDLDSILGIPGVSSSFSLSPLRIESWQLYDENPAAATYPISLIVTPVSNPDSPYYGNIYFPETTFTKDTPRLKSPYTVDMRVLVDPLQFGHTADTLGIRYFRIKNCIVIVKPVLGIYAFDNSLDTVTNPSGTFFLEGGLVYEDDGVTPFNISGNQAKLNDFMHQADTFGSIPLSDDGYGFSGVEFTWKPVPEALMSYSIISAGCSQPVSFEKAVFNAVLASEDIRPVIQKLFPVPNGKLVPSGGILPNVAGAQACVSNALATLRKKINVATVAEFSATVQTCLGDLKDQTVAAYCGALLAAISTFKSTAVIDTDVQFTTSPITVTVALKDAGGTTISNSMLTECAQSITDNLTGQVTLGEVSKFVYDGYELFTAEVTSTIPGNGELRVFYDGKVFNKVIPGSGINVTSKIEENVLPYTFVTVTAQPAVRRDSGDVAGDGS